MLTWWISASETNIMKSDDSVVKGKKVKLSL
jgi:hypothetical protein